jgi:uncharacterized protein (TIGR03000 family)
MLERMVTGLKILTLVGLGMLLAAGPANAQQGWPILGSNWDTTGGSRGSYSSSYSRGYSPSYYNSSYSSPSYYAAYPSSVGTYLPYYYAAGSSEGYYGTSTPDLSMKRAALVNLRVPSGAKIWFNTYQTKQTGTARSFETPPLDAGKEFAYQIQVQWKQDGVNVTQTRQVTVHAGDVINLTLGSSSGVAMAQ